jgi:hypothetical protein
MSKFRVTPNRRPAARGLVAAAAAAIIVATAAPGGASEAASGAPILGAGTAQAIKGSYIVVLRAGGPARLQNPGATVAKLSARYGGRVTHVYNATIMGYAADMSESAATRLAADPHVAYVEQNQWLHALDVQPNPPSWGLDRIDQRNLPFDQSYS